MGLNLYRGFESLRLRQKYLEFTLEIQTLGPLFVGHLFF